MLGLAPLPHSTKLPCQKPLSCLIKARDISSDDQLAIVPFYLLIGLITSQFSGCWLQKRKPGFLQIASFNISYSQVNGLKESIAAL